MMPLVVIVIAVAVGLARGGRIQGLSRVPLRGASVALAFFSVQFLLRQLAPTLGILNPTAIVWLWCGVSLGLVVLCASNWRIRGVPILGVGIVLNLLVVLLNTGMPVGGPLAASFDMTPTARAIDEHGGFYSAVDSQTIAAVLGDIVPVPAPRPLRSLVSLGDILMFLGVGLVIEEGVYGGRYRARHTLKSESTRDTTL